MAEAAKRAGITKRVGWYTLHHKYSTQPHPLGTKLVFQKELHRHADVRTTVHYTQPVGKDKQEARLKVAELLRKDPAS